MPDSWGHWKQTPRCFRLAMSNQQRSVAAIHPSDRIPQKPVALFRAKARIYQHGRNLSQEWACRCQIFGFFFWRDDSLSMQFAGKHSDLWCFLNFAPLFCNTKNTAKNAERSVHSSDLHALSLPMTGKVCDPFRSDCV